LFFYHFFHIVCPSLRINYLRNEVFSVKKLSAKPWIVFFAALALGVLLHFLHSWLPSPVTALISPVRESLWEHIKILYFPLLAAALILGKGAPALRTARLLAIPPVCFLMLGTAWVYHVPLRGENILFDLILYVIMMGLGFLLPRRLWPIGDWPGVTRAAVGLMVLLGGFLVWFTFSPPNTVLFADLQEGVRTFLTIPF